MSKLHTYRRDGLREGEQDPNSPITHAHLSEIVVDLPEDYEPYGKQERAYSDCASGCRWYATLARPFDCDWGVCTNPKSHRCGLLTFEHMGCLWVEPKEKRGKDD